MRFTTWVHSQWNAGASSALPQKLSRCTELHSSRPRKGYQFSTCDGKQERKGYNNSTLMWIISRNHLPLMTTTFHVLTCTCTTNECFLQKKKWGQMKKNEKNMLVQDGVVKFMMIIHDDHYTSLRC